MVRFWADRRDFVGLTLFGFERRATPRRVPDTCREARSNRCRDAQRRHILIGPERKPAWAADLRIFEVDHAASQRDRQARLRRAGIAAPPMVRYAAADLETDALGPRLEEAGLDPAQPAFVACLGC